MVSKKNFTLALTLLLIFFNTHLFAQKTLSTLLPQTLPVEQAFILETSAQDETLTLNWQIAPGCYLYQDKLAFTLLDAQQKLLPLPHFNLPPAEVIEDPFFGKQAIYQHQLRLPLSFTTLQKKSLSPIYLKIDYQGCAQSGFCYPPQTKWLAINLSPLALHFTALADFPSLDNKKLTVAEPSPVEDPLLPTTHRTLNFPQINDLAQLQDKSILVIIALFYLFGVLLSFTPCVLPMLPILFGIIVGQKHLNTKKAFWISLCYVLSMAFTYTLAGIVAATLGKNLQAKLQQPIFIISFALFFALLAFMQMGVIRLHVPQALRVSEILNKLHAKQENGTYLGAAVMGVLATLISSPCVTAPLIAALSYISHSGNVWLGGSALLALGLGMGTFLLLAGTYAGKYVPKSGPWMHTVNHAFAILMLGLSLWLLNRVFNAPWMLILWGILGLFAAWCMDTFRIKSGWSGRLGALVAFYSLVLFWGAWQGATNPLQPLKINPWQIPSSFTPPSSFTIFTTLEELNQARIRAQKVQQPIMVVFYADWCLSCQHLEHKVLTNNIVLTTLQSWQVVKIDITAFNKDSEMLLKQFELVGPPTILFFDKNGQELTHYRLIGEISSEQLIAALTEISSE